MSAGSLLWQISVLASLLLSGVSDDRGHEKYTDDPHEVAVELTSTTTAEVVQALQVEWNSLTPIGARTLAAQFVVETGGGKNCYNWNLGNVKAKSTDRHMYLRGVWEVDSKSGAQAQVTRANGLAHIANADEIKRRGWHCPPDKSITVFEPPHAQSRFRAFTSLREGTEGWLKHHRAIAARDPQFLTALNNADIPTVAKALKRARYFTAAEADYAAAMTKTKAEIDRALGPLP